MKKYFAKYLPVEEEIKEGDIVIFNSYKIDIVEKYPFRHPDADTDPDEDGYDILLRDAGTQVFESVKKVKLFLCSRDIEVGDKYKVATDGQGTLEDFTYTGEEGEIDGNCFKVIGEISPDAIWVKEGDEFDEDEIIRNVLIKDTFDDEYEYLHPKGDEPVRELGSTEKFIKEFPIGIKCSQCKHFH